MLDLSAVLNLVPYIYIFAAILMLTSDKKAALRPPGRFGNYTLRIVGSVGLLTTLFDSCGLCAFKTSWVGAVIRTQDVRR